MAEVVLKNVYKTYGENVNVVKDFNLEVKEKEFIVFVGPSGCGKSTTLRMIAGLEEISDGELYLQDEFANFLEPKERNLAFVFQSYALYPTMSVYENIAFSLRVRKVNKDEVDKRVREVAEMLGLTAVLPNRPKDLSGGQKQRVAIGNAIIRNPKLLLMDEPLSNLDAKLRTQMRVELAKIHEKLQNTIIYVTHDQIEAMTLGTRIVVMKDGIIQQVDSPKKLYQNPINRFVASFIGSPSMNFMDGRIQINGDHMYFDVLTKSRFDEKSKFLLPNKVKRALEDRFIRGNEAILGIRPEKFSYKQKSENDQYIDVWVHARELLGSDIYAYFEFQGKQMIASVPADTEVEVDSHVRLYIDLTDACVFDKETEENYMYIDSREEKRA
ncbi:MAG: ABC transporter ATP-binding protein [Lachnospiraceae bacterium]|nr:ABC transporter ATP-binding protein [Lachnospiraceae bacterium]